MESVGMWFKTGGWAMIPIAALDVAALMMVVSAALLALGGRWRRSLHYAAIALTLLALVIQLGGVGVGVVGWLQGRDAVNDALRYAEPELRLMMREQGLKEAQVPLEFGLGGFCCVGPTAMAVLGIASLNKPRRDR